MNDEINVIGQLVQRSDSMKYLGAYLDGNLSMTTQVTRKCKLLMCNVLKTRTLCTFLTAEACQTIMVSLALSYLDYANSLLLWADQTNKQNRMQEVQNITAKVTLKCGRYDRSRKALIKLHWLLIKHKINFKILCLIHKCLHDQGPII